MSLRNKILDKISANKHKSDNYIVQLHDALMAEYGWIPLEEFKMLPIQTVVNLLGAAGKRKKKEQEKMKKPKRK